MSSLSSKDLKRQYSELTNNRALLTLAVKPRRNCLRMRQETTEAFPLSRLRSPKSADSSLAFGKDDGACESKFSVLLVCTMSIVDKGVSGVLMRGHHTVGLASGDRDFNFAK